MKITVIGGGSTYTPELVEGFARRAQVLGLTELVLYDIDKVRLDIVGGLARRILARSGFTGKLLLSNDLDTAVTGAAAVLIQLRIGGQAARLTDETVPNKYGIIGQETTGPAAVLIQLRIGGQAARLTDETVPNKYGIIGQETTGPGGFAKALRTVPVVLGIADRVRELAGPDTWILDFTNPVGIVTRALQHAGHRAVGLCNVAIGFQRRLAKGFGVEPDRVRLGHAGLNHLSWIRSVQVDGEERLPAMLEGDSLTELAAQVRMPASLLSTLRSIPSYYLHYFYCTDEEFRSQQGSGGHRAEEVQAIERQLLEMYQDPELDHKPALLEQRGGAYYSEAAAALVTSLLTGDGAHHYVDVRNNGVISGLPDDAVVEVPAVVDRAGVHPVEVPDLPPEMLGLVQSVTAYEILAVEAAITGDRSVARRALLAHPLVRQWEIAEPLLAEMLTVNRRFLPAFFPHD